MKIAKDITLVIVTYNKPDFLRLILESVIRQTVMPAEIVIADDGSTDETRMLIDSYRERIPVPIIHSWIEDKGHRKTKAVNIAIAKASKKYIVGIDGDIVIMPHFIEDHDKYKQEGFFVSGSRSYLSEKATIKRVTSGNVNFHFFSKGIKRRFVLLRLPFLNRFFKGHKGLSRARGCHSAFWREDYIAVNGLEENFQGWGLEDSELIQRFYNYGIKRKNIKLQAGVVHLYHQEISRKNLNKNRELLQRTISKKRIRAEKGIDQYLETV